MPSHLRLQSSFEPVPAKATYHTSPTLPPLKKQKMSLTQTYYVASTARTKLGREAGRVDHNLRRLVGHANLLDNLMVELADAEREQEAWFHQTVQKASRPEEPRHVRWIDSITEEDDMEEDDSDSDSDMESDDGLDEDEELFNIPLRKIRSPPAQFLSAPLVEAYDDEDGEEDEELDDALALTRTASRHSPPELLLDESESDSDDDAMPPSPEPNTTTFAPVSEKQREVVVTTFYDAKSSPVLETYFPQQQPLIAAC